MSESSTLRAGGDARLAGLNVLLTSSQAQQLALAEALSATGAQSLSLPLLRIIPIGPQDNVLSPRKSALSPQKSAPSPRTADAEGFDHEPMDLAAAQANIRHKIQQLDQYSLAIFISTNAATIGAQWIDCYWPQLPVDLNFFAVGPTTASCLGALLDCKVISSENGMNSEALLSLPELSNVEDRKIVIFRGLGGRELLADTLRQRGATVDYIELYQRREIAYSSPSFSALIAKQKIDVIVALSGQALLRLVKLASQPLNSEDSKESAENCKILSLPVIVPSKRLREMAITEGFTQAISSDGADEASIINALARWQKNSQQSD